MRKCDIFSAEGEPLQRISFFRAATRNGKIVGEKKVTIIFPWVKLGKPVCRWYKSRKRSSKQEALFTTRTPSPCGKYSVYLKEIARLAGIEPGKINFETLRKNAPKLRFLEAIALLEMEDQLPRLRKFAEFLNK